MAKNRRELDSEQKRQEILLAARRLLLAEGYDATSMSRLANEAGVAPNTLYWYFKDKDELLLAILDELVAEALAEYSNIQAQSLDQQLLWLLNKFDAVPHLITTVHNRMNFAESVKTWHQRFHFMLESLVVNQLMLNGVKQEDCLAAAKIATFVVEGLLSHHAGDSSEREMIANFLVSKITKTEGKL